MNSPVILIVDDDSGQRELLRKFLSSYGFQVMTAESGELALEFLGANSVDLLVSDVRMPGMGGLELLRRVRESQPGLPVLLITGFADVRDAVEAMRDGALDYLEKPIDFNEFGDIVHSILGEVVALDDISIPPMPDGFVFQSPIMRQKLSELALISPTDARVLITGESGVGKDVIARLIHAWSNNRNGRMIAVNCAAIPANLLEAELFGHERGSFTGAVARRIGCLEEADNGTLFLDEIGEMPLELQPKLLRAMENGHFRRIGSNVDQLSRARVIAATNCNLEQNVSEGLFREDLYYRLSVVEINIPPLRERSEDVLALAQVFAKRGNGQPARISEGAEEILVKYSWPGNVRELANAIERAKLLSRGGIILPEHLPQKIKEEARVNPVSVSNGSDSLEALERENILRVLREKQWNRSAAAKALGISRRTLIYKINRYLEQGFEIPSK